MADDKSPARKKRRSSPNTEEEDAGFKFSRQSRRTTTYFKGSAKKRRRSSFVHGRKERKSLAPPSSKINLHQNIPIGLPPSARLRRLFHASLELAITKIKEQPNTIKLEEYPDFQEEAKDVFEQLQRIVLESDIIDEAFQLSSEDKDNDNKLPNPKNQQLEENALNCQTVSKRLQLESSKWDELLNSCQQLQDIAKQELQEYDDPLKSNEECPDFLSSNQHKLLSGKPTLKSVLDKLEKVKHTSELQVDMVCQTASNLKQYGDATETHLQQQMGIFGTKSVQVIEDMGTPRTLIRGGLKHHQMN
ncbi:uncharacterized protein LOC110248856 [Exaiptasia diaphana]|uniref:Uncharacterized protein n=1 Tax=Exaiptasia diaphana TaxID=2652724 RepID=A0A913XWQ0_EXADI|nr:uncharacterized protein LOC110248856 [Exaiptasia diaphana]KXJ08455.1 hypothetical protein AC249_AIPGENE6614 [Exaiptasia diaphana]